jgi:type 1 fimbria pilin
VNSPVVTLPTLTDLQANALPQNGPSPVGQQTNFSIDYTHCTLIDGGYTIQPDFSALTNFNSTTKTLANTGTATHIALGIVNPSAPNVLLDLKSNVIAAQTATTGTISFPLAATYVAQGTVTPGTVAAVAAFSTIYN